MYSKDLRLFQQGSKWFAAYLEGSRESETGQQIVIKEYQNKSFIQKAQHKVTDGVNIAVLPLESKTFVVVSENVTRDDHNMNIYEFHQNNGLKVIHSINSSGAIDVQIWKDTQQNIFMSVVQSGNVTTGPEVQIAFYNWNGESFEKFQNFNTSSTKKITPFSVGDDSYVALANAGINKGNRKSYSEILKFDMQKTMKYEPFRKILTYGCSDIAYFRTNFNKEDEEGEEHFLITANYYYDKDTGSKYGSHNNTVTSIIYKFVDDFFIPFHGVYTRGVKKWIPVQMEGEGNVILLASTPEGLQCLQYDGWRYEKCKTHLRNVSDDTIKDVSVLHYGKLQDKNFVGTVVFFIGDLLSSDTWNKCVEFDMNTMLCTISFDSVEVIITKNSDEVLVEINSSHEHKVRKLHDELLFWCMSNVKLVDALMVMPSDNVLGKTARRGDNIEEIDSASQQNAAEKDELLSELNIYKNDLSILEDTIGKSSNPKSQFDENTNIIAKTLIVKGRANIKSVDTDMINNIRTQVLLENVIDLNEGFEIKEAVHFKAIQLDQPIVANKINNIDKDNVIHTNSDIEFDDIETEGDLHCEHLTVTETINNIKFGKNNILMKIGQQNFSDFSVENLVVNNLIATKFDGQLENNTSNGSVSKIGNLTVKDLRIGGYMNGVKITTLYKYALRNAGDQKFTVPCFFNHLEAENLDTKTVSDKRVSGDMVKITGGDYNIKKDVRFTKDVTVANLTALRLLNNIPVRRDGQLDILLKDVQEQQSITGTKKFENLEIMDSIKLQGKIVGRAFDKMKTFVTIESNLLLVGDKRITGDVVAEEIIRADNIIVASGEGAPMSMASNVSAATGEEHRQWQLNSLRRVESEALRLTDVEIPNRMSFFQHLNVDDVFARKINNIDTRLLVVNGAKQTQVVQGWKKFRGDLEITGSTKVARINGIDMEEMERNVMKRGGDQVIEGKHHVKFVAADGGINANTTNFGKLPWKDVIRTNEDQSINGTITFTKNLTAKSITAQTVDVRGLINNENFAAILDDAVTKDSIRKITGMKTFDNVTIHFLETPEKFEESEMNSRTVRLSDIDMIETISVKNIAFDDKLNEMNKDELNNFLNQEIELVLEGNKKLGNMTVFGNVYIESQCIGNISLEDFVNNTMKKDEQLDFDTVEFQNIIVNRGIDLEGHLENLDLENIFQNNQTNGTMQSISYEKIFHGNVSIVGNTLLNDTLNTFALSEMCGFVSSTDDEKELVLKGNAIFTKGPEVKQINDIDLQNILERSWFKDESVNISGNIEFENATIFNSVILTDLFNDVNLAELEKSYLSKSKDQKITQIHIISDFVTFEDDVSTPELIIDGQINGIKLETFQKTILLNRTQLFEDMVYFENIAVRNVHGAYKVNGLDLENDVMRFDKINKVIGEKTFYDLEADVLELDKNIKVQDVAIAEFATKAVLRSGNFRIEGNPIINSARFEIGLSLMGNLNSMSFDDETLLLKRSPQNITGRVSFGTQAETKFKALKVRGLVNDADIEKLVHNQVSKTGDSIFQTAILFHKNLKAKNVNFEGLYHDINVSELLENITKLSSLNNLKENYLDLIKESEYIEKSFQDQAFYIDDFKQVFADHAAALLSIRLENNEERVALLSCKDNYMYLDLFAWNPKEQQFEEKGSRTLGDFPGFSTKVTIRGIDYLYYETEKGPDFILEGRDIMGKNIEYTGKNNPKYLQEDYESMNHIGIVVKRDTEILEHESGVDDFTHIGLLMSFENETTLSKAPFLTQGTLYLMSFELPIANIECLLFIDFLHDVNIVCMSEDDQFYLHQSVFEINAYMASFIKVNDQSFLITMGDRTDQLEPRMTIWKFNIETQLFERYQQFFRDEPGYLSVISSPHGHFISVTYDYKTTTFDFGKVIIWRFDSKYDKFLKWQSIKVDAPTRAEFANLPSGELSLYVTTQNPVSPLIVYIYEGISGFNEKMVSSLIPNVMNMNQFSIRTDHFLVLQNNDEINVLHGIFKGHKTT